MFIKLTVTAILLIIISLGSLQKEAMADDNISQYVQVYNNLCNLKLSDNIKADLLHSSVSLNTDNTTMIKLSGDGLNITRGNSTYSQVDIRINGYESMVAMKYEF